MSLKEAAHSFKSIFVAEVPDTADSGKAGKIPVVAQTPLTSGFSSIQAPVAPQHPDPQALQKLESMAQQAIQETLGAFVEQEKALQDVIPDETTRLRAALKTAHTTALLATQAMDQVLGKLEHAKQDFESQFEAQMSAVNTSANQSTKATDDLIETRQNQLQSLQEEIQSLRSKRAAQTDQLGNEIHRLLSVKAGFEAAHADVVGKLSNQRQKLAQLQG